MLQIALLICRHCRNRGSCARFLLGRGYEKPSGMCSCANCKYLNKPYAVICEACHEPYGKSAPSA